MEVLFPVQSGFGFEDGDADFFGGARVNRGFVDDDGALSEGAGDRARRVDQWAKVGLMCFIDGGWDADKDHLAIAERFGIAGKLKALSAQELARFDLSRRIVTRLQAVDMPGRCIVPGGLEASPESDGQRQADVP